MIRDAYFSSCGKYRYYLSRKWDDEMGNERCTKGMIVFIGLNPSKADATTDDPTIKKVMHIARREGYSGVYMLNLFAIVSTDPEVLITNPNSVGERNDHWLSVLSKDNIPVVFCWGAFPEAEKRSAAVIEMFPDALCLGHTKDGHPKHPCRLANATPLIPFNQLETL